MSGFLHFERFVYVCGLSNERAISHEPCSDWSAILEKNKSLNFARAFGDRRLGRAVSGAASRSEAMDSISPWLRGGLSLPRRLASLSD